MAREAEPPAGEADRRARQPAYVAQISVRESGIDTEREWKAMEAGMAAATEIKAGQRQIIGRCSLPC